jgi:hypothetical protein
LPLDAGDFVVRIISLLKIAAEAEVLRLRVTAERQGRRAALGAIALVFAIGALILAEMTGWQVLRLYVASIAATVILLGANLIIATVLGFFAARASPSRSELEALRVRRQALEAARGSLAFTAAIPAATALLRLGRGQRARGSWLQPFNR